MNKPIAIFYHCVFQDSPTQVWTMAPQIINEQMGWLRDVGLLHSTTQMHCGINGGLESAAWAESILPEKSFKTLHGLQCKNELRTLRMLETWLKLNPGWNVLYFHSKGVTKPTEMATRWRNCMMRQLVSNWRQCQEALKFYDSVGCHWLMPPLTPPGQNIWAGNFWWATSDFLATLPKLEDTWRVKNSGIDSIESRYEAEVWIGNGSKLPRVLDMHPNGLWQCP